METSSLFLNTPFSVWNFHILINFMAIYGAVWLLCAHPIKTSIVFHTRRHNTHENVSYILGFKSNWLLLFAFWWTDKHDFTSIHIAQRVMYKGVSGFWMPVIVYQTEIKAKTSFSCGLYFQLDNWKIPVFIYILMCW